MPNMKHLLRKLHIGGGINDQQRLGDTPPVISPSPNPSSSSPSSASLISEPSTMGIIEPNELVGDRTAVDATSDKGVDFNFMEEEFQVQLALAISVSDPDGRKDPDSAQIDAAKQMSLGCAASTTGKEAFAEFQSLRYWNYNVVDYDDKVMNGFYDVCGITSNLIARGKMPLLMDLQTTSISENVDYEVILVNRLVDAELQELERRVYTLFIDCPVSEQGQFFSGMLQKIANVVANRMGGPVGDADEMLRRWRKRSYELQSSLNSVILPLGCLDVGLSRHRALLFKVLADRINIPCMLVKGSYYTGTDDGAVNLIKTDNGSEFIIDLMGAPGSLIPAEVPSSQLQNSGFDVRGFKEETPKDTCLTLDDGTGRLAVSSDPESVPGVGSTRTEEILFTGMEPKEDGKNHIGINQMEGFGHDLEKLLHSLRKSSESSLGTSGKASPAQKMQVKNVSKYVLSAAQNPEFAQKLHAVLLESGASPPPDLFSDINPQVKGEEKAVGPSPAACSVSNSRFCQSAEGLTEQQKGLGINVNRTDGSLPCENTTSEGFVFVGSGINEPIQTDTTGVNRFSAKLPGMFDEQVHELSLTFGADSNERQIGVAQPTHDKRCSQNKLGRANNAELGNEFASQLMETPNRDILINNDGNSERVNQVLGEAAEWEIPWEDLHIGDRIGIGSYGEVYHADWNGTEVAVKKFLDQDFSGDALVQFKMEVEIMLRLRHPNVVLFMGAITRPPHFSILTEFLPRGSLYRLLHRPNFHLDEKRRMRMALDVAKGMNYLHTSHPIIVHRDLKSPNLLVDKNWVVKVCDFGLSRMKHHTFLSSKSTAGTPEWMAPEVLRNEPANEKCDVYSFGVILWELATLQIPWKGLNPMQVVGAVGFQNRRLEIPEKVNPVVSQMICDCWQMEPQLRALFLSANVSSPSSSASGC
ncbi:Mitogen-activated protein kinase kinase kinase [Quillaja saponaria]|uniref:non-specific serine/threonine protein kinase n=1 Tax=Quillaja saponaria TaxID=32244 RepID=A0AAD7PKM4_QUISA|nr:Mitogen-activated protein kinase kinase kinase [Quillaja saponaria]